MNTDINIIDEHECIKALFSEELCCIYRYILKYNNVIEEFMDEYEESESVLVILDYINTHNFDKLEISTEESIGLPFPYMPTLLFTEEDVRKEFIEGLETDFPNTLAMLFIRDLEVLDNLIYFALDTGVFDIATNDIIALINQYMKTLYSIYEKNVKPYLEEDFTLEIDKLLPEEYEFLTTNEIFSIYAQNRGNIVKQPTMEEIQDYYEHEDKLHYLDTNNLSPIIGDMTGSDIGNIVDIFSIYPYNLSVKNKIIHGVIW